MKLKLLFITIGLFVVCEKSFGQISEGFESTTTPATGWTYTSVTHGTNNPKTGTRCATFNATNDAITTPVIACPTLVSF